MATINPLEFPKELTVLKHIIDLNLIAWLVDFSFG